MRLQQIVRLLLSLLILIALLISATGLRHYPFLQQLENWTYDSRLNFTRPDTVDENIVIVDIDEISIAKVGRFPWKRNVLSTLVNNLFDHYQIKTLGFDILFAEKDTSSGLESFSRLATNELKNNTQYLAALEKIRPSLEFDRIFAQSLLNRDVILGYYFKREVKSGEDAEIGVLPSAISDITDELSQRLPIYEARAYNANLPVLQNATKYGGFFDNPSVDADGVFRRVPLVQSYNGQLYPSLALATAKLALGNPQIEFLVETDGKQSAHNYFALEAINLGKNSIPVDHNAAVYVPYRGRQGSFKYFSAYQILNQSVDREYLKDKIVLIGTSAPGLLDLRSTPVQNVFPGVEVHANIIAGILNQSINQKPAWASGYEFLILILLAIIMYLILTYLSPILAGISTLAMIFIVISGTLLAWQYLLILPLASPLLLIAMMFTLHMTYGFFIESRGKRQLAHMFGQYIPPELVDEMSESASEFSLEGESREMTVLFSDVRGFTTISEGLDPKQLTMLMNAILTPMTRIIHKNRGTIDKYIGDAIMAFWGAPLQDTEHARHALYAAFGMIQELNNMQQEFREKGWPAIKIGIGLNTGVMNVGNMGSEFRVAYTVLGDTVNLGARLEGLTKAYGVDIIVNETTRNAVPEFIFKELDRVRVKGKKKPVTIYEPIGHKNDIDKSVTSEISRYKQALRIYHQQQWDKAEMEFFNLSQSYPDCKLYSEYLNRINRYRSNPPGDDWDGVFTHTSK